MIEFLHDAVQYDFVRRALIAGLLASVACGVVGTCVVVKRVTYLAGGVAHCALGGIGAAVYLRARFGWDWLDPLHGGVVAAIAAAALIGLLTQRGRQREDTTIGAVWAIGMALGVALLAATPGYRVDPMVYLFGDILTVTSGDLWIMTVLNVVVLVVVWLLHNTFAAMCFDEEFARVRGVSVERCTLLLLALTALTVIVLVKVVGVVLVLALLALPPAIASAFCRTLPRMMITACVLTAIFNTSGMAVSHAVDLPAGAVIVLLAGGVYLLVAALSGARLPARLRTSDPRRRKT